MRILATQYTLATKSLEIYLAGCSGNKNGCHCEGCHNPESWDFNNGEVYNKTYLLKICEKINSFDKLIQNIMIFGGEPNDNDKSELKSFLFDLKQFQKPIWLFTRYYKEELPKFEFELCDYIKCGEYNKDLKSDNNEQYGIKLATSNQYILKKGVDY